MRTIVKGKNIEVPERVRGYAERKFARLERVLDDRTDALVELSMEQHRSDSDSHIVEVTLVIDGRTLRGHAAGPSFQAGLDELLDKMERRAVDHKEKPRLRARPVEEKALLRRIADGTAEAGHERRIVKSKRFAIEPMFEEDASREMEELGHSFFVFVNAETEHIAILYRRRDGDYGLIEPIVGGEYGPGKYGRGQNDGRTDGRAGWEAPAGVARSGADRGREERLAARVRPAGRRPPRGS
jgi:putative sigma-54 modulation protein